MAKLGQAHPLPGKLWELWLQFVLHEVGPDVYAVIFLTQALCVRVTQAAQLTAADVKLSASRVWIAPFKGHPGTFKPLLPSVAKVLRSWYKTGISGGTKFSAWAWPKKVISSPPRRAPP
jgi:hypothetical protein